MLRNLLSRRPCLLRSAARCSSGFAVEEPICTIEACAPDMSSMALGGGLCWPIRDYDHKEMWVHGNGALVLLSVEVSHSDDLKSHWDLYDLYDAVGCPNVAQWGILDSFVDER